MPNKTDATTALTAVGAMVGLGYGVLKNKPFWATAIFTIIFATGGAALGTAIQTLSKEKS
jgi:divalent metal cation (Fe/Co/Zn/Cd) transporter